MILLDQMKNMKIYKRPLFLPTLEDNKKTKAAIMLLTPNYESSKQLMNHPLLINRLRYQSYYLEQDLSYYINGKVAKNATKEEYVNEVTNLEFYNSLYEMSADERNKLKDSQFGLPRKRKYPLNNEAHVKSAIRFFNYVDKEDEKELAGNISRAIKRYKMKVNIGNNNRLKKYIKEDSIEEYKLFDVVKESENVINTIETSVKYTSLLVETPDRKIMLDLKDEIYHLPKVDSIDDNYTLYCTLYYIENTEEGEQYCTNNVYICHDTNNKDWDTSYEWVDFDELMGECPKGPDVCELLNNFMKKSEDLSDTLVDNLTSFIRFSGYTNDLDVIRKIVTPALYYTIISRDLQIPIKKMEDIPVLNVTVIRGEILTASKTTTEEGNPCICVDIPAYDGDGNIKNYVYKVTKAIYHAFLVTEYPDRYPILYKIIEDYFTANDTVYGAYGRHIASHWNIKQYMMVLDNNDLKSVYELLVQNKDFIDLKISELENYSDMDDRFIGQIKDVVDKPKELMILKPQEAPTNESYIFDEAETAYKEDFIRLGDNLVTFLNEDGRYDSELRRLLYKERIKQRSVLLEILKKVKDENPWIKFAYPDLKKYGGKNLFVDLYYYNELFFKNNSWKLNKGYSLYLELFSRLIKDPRIKQAGYEKVTVFIPINDWNIKNSTKMWMYRDTINPVSIIYNLMKTKDMKFKNLFKDINIVFFTNRYYFKLNVSEVEDLEKESIRFKRFITVATSKMDFDDNDIDVENVSKETPEAIKNNIADKIEASKGVDITPNLAKAAITRAKVSMVKEPVKEPEKITPSATEAKKPIPAKPVTKAAAKTEDEKKPETNDKTLDDIANAVDSVARVSANTDTALDNLDRFEDVKRSLIDINNSDDGVIKVSSTRAARMNKLDQEFLDSSVKGKSVKELLEVDNSNKELETSDLKISSPNEEWKHLTYMNFDRDYDLDKDIVNCFYHFTKVSKPISIRNISVKDNSTSEDRLELYTVEMEDFRGKRFSIKVDIPKMEDNRFLLRGNTKTIQTQLFNMPIVKTNLDACQIVTNYQKIFVYRVNTVTGRSVPNAGRFLKAVNKYTGNKIKFTFGDNAKISNKYELPVDYIDLSGALHKIETNKYIIYFNQDDILAEYKDIDEAKGVPFAYDKQEKRVIYYTMTNGSLETFSTLIMRMCSEADPSFEELFRTQKPSTSGSYTRCNILNEKIPMILILSYLEGLTNVLKKANIVYELKEKLTSEERNDISKAYLKFKDGYILYDASYDACMLLNGFTETALDIYSITDIDNKNMYLEMFDNYGGKIKTDGLENFYDCLVDPMSYECLKHYGLPTSFTEILLYANSLLCDNKFIKHTDTTSRRIRRNELVAAYTYEALSAAYGTYANMIKHGRTGAEFTVKQSVVIDKILTSPVSSDSSIINALNAIETTNALTYKGKSGLNSDRSYSLDKRTYDDSMLNVIGMSTGFSANIGITRQATIDMNVEGYRGYVKTINKDFSKMNAAKSLSAVEALTPFGTTRDDAPRTYMTFVQTAKHSMRTEDSDPLLVTNGFDEAMPYITIDKFAFKAKKDGKIKEVNDEYIIVEYTDGSKDFINLVETVEKNSDAGFYVPLKLDKVDGLRPGTKVSKDQLLAYDKYSFSNKLGESDNVAYNIGKLVKVAIINTDDGFEDAGMCSEKLSNELATRIIKKEEHVIDKDANVVKMLKIGDHIEPGDALMLWNDPHDDEEADIAIRLLSSDNDTVSELGRKSLINEHVSGTIRDIKIYRTVDISELSPSLQKIVKQYEAPIKELKKKLDEEGIDSTYLPATYKLDPTGKLKKAQEAIYVEFYLEYMDTVALGDKIVYFTANKATVKNILPKEKCPYTDFRPNEPIDAFVSSLSVEKRQVTSSIINGSLNKLMVELDRTCKDMLGIPYDETKV